MKEKKNSVIQVGLASMLVIFISLCLAVLAALSLSTARNDNRLSEKQAERNRAYYEAVNRITEAVADTEGLKKRFGDAEQILLSEKISDVQNLEAVLLRTAQGDYRIVSECVVYSGSWEADDSLPVRK